MLMTVLVAIVGLWQASVPSVTDAGWLSGCWKSTTGNRSVTEQWLPPEGDTMLGVSRTISGGKTVEYEFILIRRGQHGLEYVAKPSRQREAIFTSTRVTSREIVFENPAHDFPTRITYRKVDGGLVATVDGMMNGKARAIEFRYSAADCSR